MMQLPTNFLKGRRLETLVENRTSYTLNNAALHVFETHMRAERVLLQFDQPVLASMLMGKKVMHLRDRRSFDFLPGESLILPKQEMMCIDFPEADERHPTRCLAMAISEERIREVLQLMNETMPKADGSEWGLMDYSFHFTNDIGIHQILQRLLYLFTEDHVSKDLFVDNMLKELIIRILQANSKKAHMDKPSALTNEDRLGHIIGYIRGHLYEPLTIGALSQKACMSESHFYRVFKNEMGVSPVEFINNERIGRAAGLLRDPNRKIKEVFMECGFESRSYFNRVFKRMKKLSPSEFQAKMAHP